jgi:hypothetical protein
MLRAGATELLLVRDLENDFQLDRRGEGKTCDSVHQAAGVLVFSKDVLQQVRSAVCDFRQLAAISRRGYRHTEPDDARHSVERSQILTRDSKTVERREVSGLAPRFDIEFRAHAPSEFRGAAFGRKHPGEEKKIARLDRFGVGAERFRRCRKIDAKFHQALLGTARPRRSWAYHLPKRATRFMRGTSPVSGPAFVRETMMSMMSVRGDRIHREG